LFIYNADCKEETITRINYVAKQIGDKEMTYVMALLILPTLMDMTRDTKEYKTFLEDKNNRILN
jgi:cell division protein ZapA (FtsZ GTPase activity inhibitor)